MPRPTCSPISRSARHAAGHRGRGDVAEVAVQHHRAAQLGGGHLRGLRGGLGHHALERALAHLARQQRAEEALLALGRAREQLAPAQRAARPASPAPPARRCARTRRRPRATVSDGSRAGARQLAQRRPADPDLALAQLAGQERDGDRRLLRRGEPQRVGERGDLAAARARGGDGLGGGGEVGEQHDARVRGMSALPPGPSEPPRRADPALAAAADLVPGVVPAALRRRVQRHVPRLPVADGDALRPGGDPRALHGARPHAAARPDARAAADHGLALAAAARGPRAPRAAQADAAAVPRRAHARVRGDRARGGRARGLEPGPAASRSRSTRGCRRSRSR